MIGCLLLAAVVIAGCGSGGSLSTTGGPSQKGGDLKVAMAEEANSLFPQSLVNDAAIESQICETLFQMDKNGDLIPWLAAKVDSSEDQKTWTVKIRPQVRFSDGKRLTAEDVAFSLNQARTSQQSGPLFTDIANVRAINQDSVVITASAPTPELPSLLSLAAAGIMPANFGGESKKAFEEKPICTGPFALAKWNHGESILLKKNPYYWQKGRPYLQTVTFEATGSPESRVAQLEAGDVGLAYSPLWAQIQAIEAQPGVEVGKYPMGFVEFLVLNARSTLFQNAKIRKAISLAIDRKGINEATLAGRGLPAGSWIPPTVPYSDQSIAAPSKDISAAKALVEEAKAEGVAPSFTLLTTGENPYWGSAAQIVQQDLKAAGLSVKLQSLDEGARIELLAKGEYDASVLEAYSSIPSPSELEGLYNANEGLFTGADTTHTTMIMEEAAKAVDTATRRQRHFKFQSTLAAENFVIPVTYSPFMWAFQDKLVGFGVSSMGTPELTEAGFSE